MNDTIAIHYNVTHNAWGEVTTKWFDTKAQAKAHAKGVVRLGYTPSITAYDVSESEGYINPRASFFDLGYVAWALVHQEWWARG